MRKRRIALCDWNEKYIFQLEEYFRGIHYLPFQADVYTNYESYCEYEEKYHYAGVLVAVTPFVLIGGILVGQSSKSGLFVLVLALALLAWFIHMGRRSSLRFDGNSVMYTERSGKEMIYRASDIACVTWDDGFRLNGLKGRMAPKRRILSMRSLVIRLHTGKDLAFDQMFYWGLGDMYQRLSQWLLAYQSAEEAKE